MRHSAVLLVLLAIVAPGLAEEPETQVTEGVLRVSEIAICPQVENRQCLGAAESFPADTGILSCLTRVNGAAGEATITHVWIKDGSEMRRIDLPVRSASWRTWSQKNVTPGRWTVRVLDATGAEIGSTSFTVGP